MVPLVEPRWSARRLSAAEVLALARGEDAPGIDRGDPRVRSIRRCTIENIARSALSEARRTGYLSVRHYRCDPETNDGLTMLCYWWCAAAGPPSIVMEIMPATDAVRIRCDLSPTGGTWDFVAFAQIARLISPLHASAPGGWLFTDDVLEVDGLDMESAISVARGLVDLGTAGRFLRDADTAWVGSPVLPPGRSPVPIERTGRAG